MNINLQLNNERHYNITINEAVNICSEYWAIHGDCEAVITNVSNLQRVTQFKPFERDCFYTIEQLVELKPYFHKINISEMK